MNFNRAQAVDEQFQQFCQDPGEVRPADQPLPMPKQLLLDMFESQLLCRQLELHPALLTTAQAQLRGAQAQLEEAMCLAVGEVRSASKAVIPPSAIKKNFPPEQHTMLQGATYFLSQGMVPPWPTLAANVLAKMNQASHRAFSLLLEKNNADYRGSEVMVRYSDPAELIAQTRFTGPSSCTRLET